MKPTLRKNGSMMAEIKVKFIISYYELYCGCCKILIDNQETWPTKKLIIEKTKEYLKEKGACDFCEEFSDRDEWQTAKKIVMSKFPEFFTKNDLIQEGKLNEK